MTEFYVPMKAVKELWKQSKSNNVFMKLRWSAIILLVGRRGCAVNVKVSPDGRLNLPSPALVLNSSGILKGVDLPEGQGSANLFVEPRGDEVMKMPGTPEWTGTSEYQQHEVKSPPGTYSRVFGKISAEDASRYYVSTRPLTADPPKDWVSPDYENLKVRYEARVSGEKTTIIASHNVDVDSKCSFVYTDYKGDKISVTERGVSVNGVRSDETGVYFNDQKIPEKFLDKDTPGLFSSSSVGIRMPGFEVEGKRSGGDAD